MRLGVAHHLGWAVAVTASSDHEVHDRRRIELVDSGLPAAPVHHVGGPHALHRPGAPVSLAAWPPGFPEDIAVQRRVPYESRADSVMYRQVLADAARRRGWAVHLYEAKSVEPDATRLLGARAHDVLHGPRATLGPPWSKDHRMALAATVLAGSAAP